MEKITVPSGSDIYLMVLKDIFHIIILYWQNILIKDIFIYNCGKNHISSGSDIYLLVLKNLFHIISIIWRSILVKGIVIFIFGKNHSFELFRYIFNGTLRYISYNINTLTTHYDQRYFVLQLRIKSQFRVVLIFI
jgi:hypothetical protein